MGNDKLNALAKYEFRNGQDTSTTFSTGLQRRVHIISTDVNYQPSARTVARLHLAWRKSQYGDDPLAGPDGLGTSSSAQLLSARVSRELGSRFEFDLFGGRLFDSTGGQWNLGAELSYQIGRDMLLGLGYNALGFRDDELLLDGYSRKGLYARLRWKFDEDLLSGGPRSESRLANANPRSTVDANALGGAATGAVTGAAPDVIGVLHNPGVVGNAPVTSDNPRALPTGNSPASLDQAPADDDLVQEEQQEAAPEAGNTTPSSSPDSARQQEGAAQ